MLQMFIIFGTRQGADEGEEMSKQFCGLGFIGAGS